MAQPPRVRAQQTLECGEKLGILHEFVFEPIGDLTPILSLELRRDDLVERIEMNTGFRILSHKHSSSLQATLTTRQLCAIDINIQ
jgi:hypothetical protein